MIIVYTPGRVGTVSLRTNLSRNINDEIFGMHSMNAAYALDNIPRDKNSVNIHANKLEKLDNEFKSGRQIKVLTSVRDPIARAISAYCFFHEAWTSKPSDLRLEHFLENYNHDWALNWFDNEIKENFGLDVYANLIDINKGWCHLKNDMISLIILKFTHLSKASDAIKESWGFNLPQTLNVNGMSIKPSYQAYSRLKMSRFPMWYCKKMYDNKYVRKFFTKAEIDTFYRKWSK